ncbi:MAG: hypothetical protein AAFV53_12955 [Myxococcota bacterium]
MRTAVLLSIAALSLFSSTASAKDLGNRLGIGVQTQLDEVPAASIRYGLPTANPARNIQIEGDFGVRIRQGDPTRLVAGGRLLYALVVEDNMNLYAYGGGAYIDEGGASIVRIQPGVEAQAFPFGLENLGVTAGVGVNLDLGGGETGVETVGSVIAGVHYWF